MTSPWRSRDHGDHVVMVIASPWKYNISQCDGDKWADMVETMLSEERSKDKQQRSTVKLTEREVLLEDEILNHKP